MDFKKLLGYGFVVWVAGYLVAMVFVSFYPSEIAMNVAILLVTAVAAYIAGRRLALPSVGKMLSYSLAWVVVSLILQALFTVPFTGWASLYSWAGITAGILILVAPLLGVRRNVSIPPQIQV